jgi:hypothetical protein
MTVQIPSHYTSKFKDFFTSFDIEFPKLGIRTYGLSVTTLEQVFLEIGHMDDPSSKIKDSKMGSINDSQSDKTPKSRNHGHSRSHSVMLTNEKLTRYANSEQKLMEIEGGRESMQSNHKLIGVEGRNSLNRSYDGTSNPGLTKAQFFSRNEQVTPMDIDI